MPQVQNIGDALPALTRETDSGTIDLADYVGKPVVIYFYPKDNTPGCTTQGGDFRDLYQAFQQHETTIFGVSRDSVKSHLSFRNTLNLPFALIADGDEQLCQAFDVIKPKKLYGKEYIGIERSTFLFTAQGTLAQQWRKVRVPGHVQQVLQAVQQLGETI